MICFTSNTGPCFWILVFCSKPLPSFCSIEPYKDDKRVQKIAIYAGAKTFVAWQLASIEALIAAGVSITAIAVAPEAEMQSSVHWSPFWSLVSKLWRPKSVARRQIDELPPEIARIKLRDSSRANLAERLCETHPDAILYFGDGRQISKLISVITIPIWHFEFGEDGNHYPLCVIETIQGADVVRARLLNSGARGAAALKTGHLRIVKHSFSLTIDHVLFEVAKWPSYVLSQSSQAEPKPLNASNPIRPNARLTLRFLTLLTRNWASQKIRYLFFEERWTIGIVEQPVEAFLLPQFPKVTWFEPKSSMQFIADPFGVAQEDGIVVLCELFDYALLRGRICKTTFHGGAWDEILTEVLPFKTHASFPFILSYNNELYCVPETYQANEINLFKAVDFPTQWRKVKTLMTGVSGIDTVIFPHEGRWWLLCTLMAEGPHHKLYAWYSDDLFGEWLPHTQNPIKIDVRSSRNAGPPFHHEHKLYRPAQDCAASYGSAVTINEVVELTPHTFNESTVKRLTIPPQQPNSLGIHTLTGVGGFSLVDGKRRQLTARGLRYELSRPFRLAKRLLRPAMRRGSGR